MQKLYKIFGLIILVILVSSCQEDYLERYPLDNVSSADFMKQTADLELYVNQFYKREIFPYSNLNNGYDAGIFGFDINSDNHIGDHPDDRLNGVRVIPANGGGWNYNDVRSINWFFDNYKRCEDHFDKYKQYVGEAYFFRAIIFFNLVKHFGDVLWLDTELDPSSPELFAPRTKRDIVIGNILNDLDSAILYLTPGIYQSRTRLNKESALTLQSRVALYEGTWEKYHSGTEFGVDGKDGTEFLKIAAKAAKAVIDAGNYSIYNTGKAENDYYDLFNLADYSKTSEIILWKVFKKDLEVTNFRLTSLLFPYGTGLTKGLADSYLCTDGKPISISNLFLGHDDISKEMTNRDPRFYQTIFTPQSPWKIKDGKTTSFNDGVYAKLYSSSKYNTTTAYIRRKGFTADDKRLDLSGEDSPSIIFRYAEVLLNYAEAQAELGVITQNDLDISINKLRNRVGMPNLVLSNINIDTDWDFPNLSPIINEVRRERRVELAIEGYRWDDMARWAAADELVVGKRYKGFWVGNQYAGKIIYKTDENGFVDPNQLNMPNGYGFKLDRDYLDPIPSNELTLNPSLGQNPGWK